MSDQTRPTDRPTTDPTRAALEALVKWSEDPKPSPNIPGCDCRKPDETWDDVDEDAPLVLCAMHERRWGPVQRDTAVMVLMDLEAALHEARRLIADIPLAALAAEPRGSSGVVEQSATQRKHEYHSERTDFDFWCIASCHDDGRCDGECDPDCESCPIPCPLCEAAAPPATGPVVVGTMTEEEGRAFIEAATGTAPPETDTTPHASSVPHATGAVERECVCSVRADDCGLPCPCWHHTPAPAPSPSARVAEVRRRQASGGGPVSAVMVSRSPDAPSPSAALVEAREWLTDYVVAATLGQIDVTEVSRRLDRLLAAARAEGVDVGALAKALQVLVDEDSGGWHDWLAGEGTMGPAIEGLRVARKVAAAYQAALAARSAKENDHD
jgi:hypothetical protein